MLNIYEVICTPAIAPRSSPIPHPLLRLLLHTGSTSPEHLSRELKDGTSGDVGRIVGCDANTQPQGLCTTTPHVETPTPPREIPTHSGGRDTSSFG